jgi:hypothetical protein
MIPKTRIKIGGSHKSLVLSYSYPKSSSIIYRMFARVFVLIIVIFCGILAQATPEDDSYTKRPFTKRPISSKPTRKPNGCSKKPTKGPSRSWKPKTSKPTKTPPVAWSSTWEYPTTKPTAALD